MFVVSWSVYANNNLLFISDQVMEYTLRCLVSKEVALLVGNSRYPLVYKSYLI